FGDWDYAYDPSNAIIFAVYDTLPANASATFAVFVRPFAQGLINNQAGVSAFEQDNIQANNISSITTTVNLMADLALSATASPNTVVTSSNITYTLTVSNKGPSTATSVMVTNRLPSTVSNIVAQATLGSCSIAGTVVTCSL